jgi:hypothetical protein
MLTGIISAPNPYIIARTLASQGLAVFPVRAKQPLTPKGVYSATCDLGVLARMDGWRNADACGLATGKASGVDVLDVDVRSGMTRVDRKSPHHGAGGDGVNGLAVLAQMGALPETLTAQTPSGGRHFYFRHIAGARSRKLCADGSVEWFSTGKLVVVPPAPGRTWLNDAPIAEAPDWLRAMVLAPTKHSSHAEGAEGEGTSGPLVTSRSINAHSRDIHVPREIYLLIVRGMRGAEPYAQRRVRGLWANLAAKASRRNDGLNYTAWQYSVFVATDDLSREIAAKLLWRACEANGYLAKDGAGVVKEVITRVLQLEERSNCNGKEQKWTSTRGGIKSRVNVERPVRTGAPRERIRHSGVAQIGQRVGNHVTNQGATGYGGINPFGAGQGYRSELGNSLAVETQCGPGGSREVMRSGSQGMTGAPAKGNPPPAGNALAGWERK